MRNILLLIAYTLLALPYLLNARSAKGIFNAVKNNQINLIASEVKKGALINAYNKGGYTPLMEAVMANEVAMAKTLLEYGANADQTMRSSNETALMMAAQNGDPRMIHLLRNNPHSSADSTMKDADEKTAADYAIKYKHPDIIGLLK